MALSNLRTAIGTCNSADTFNTLIANYSVSNKIQATFSGEPYAHFDVFGVDFTSAIYQSYSTGIWNYTVSCFIDEENEILVLTANNLCFMVLFYGDQKNYLIAPQCVNGQGASVPYAVYNQNSVPLSISEVGEPSIVNDTFTGYLFYTENKVFTEVVRYMTTPTALLGTNIKTPTKDIMIVTNATNSTSVGGCIAVALNL